MAPANRVRLIVAALAAAASVVVVGVVYATRQDPPQPSARCKQGMTPYIVPGAPTANVAAVRAAFERGPQGAAQALQPLALEAGGGPAGGVPHGAPPLRGSLRADAQAALPPPQVGAPHTHYQ